MASKPTEEFPPKNTAQPDPESLETELRTCAASEQDLALVILEYGNSDDPEGTWFGEFKRMAQEHFGNKGKGIIFDRGERSIGAILPGLDLDQGIARAEEFKAKIPSTFSQALGIGLSSRSQRLIDSGRLLLEADSALERSTQDPAFSIVAFKSDPDKYRAFLQNKA
jgi:hypothetical protein